LDIERRIEGKKTVWALRDGVLTNGMSSQDTFNAWRNPLYEILAISDGHKDQSIEVATTRFVAQYLIGLLNFVEATVDIQQRLNEKLVKAASAENQTQFWKTLRSIRRETSKLKMVTPEDVQNLKWITEYLRRQSKVG
jgi:predicted phage-related endonuclease